MKKKTYVKPSIKISVLDEDITMLTASSRQTGDFGDDNYKFNIQDEKDGIDAHKYDKTDIVYEWSDF